MKSARIIPETVKQAIFDLFEDDIFLDEITNIFRDFIYTTWYMDEKSLAELHNKFDKNLVSIPHVQQRLLHDPINELIRSKVNKDKNSFILNANDLNGFVKILCTGFASTERNNELCERIIKEWYNSFNDSYTHQNYLIAYLKHLCHQTHHALNLNSKLYKNERLEIRNEIYKQRLNFLNQISNNQFTGYHFNQFDRFDQLDSSLSPKAQYVICIFLIYLIAAILYKSFNLPNLFCYTVITGITLFIISDYNKRNFNRVTVGFLTHDEFENTELTNQHITRIFLKSLVAGKNKIVSTAKIMEEKPDSSIIMRKPKRKYDIKQEPGTETASLKIQDCFFASPETKKIIIKKKKEVKEKIKHAYYMETRVISVESPVTWMSDKENSAIYKYKPHKLNCIIVPLQSFDGYIKSMITNNYLLCLPGLAKIPKKLDAIVFDEVYRLCRLGLVVRGENEKGIVYRGAINSETSFSAKPVHMRFSSHVRCLFKPLNESYKAYENGQVVNKVLHIAYKWTNK